MSVLGVDGRVRGVGIDVGGGGTENKRPWCTSIQYEEQTVYPGAVRTSKWRDRNSCTFNFEGYLEHISALSS